MNGYLEKSTTQKTNDNLEQKYTTEKCESHFIFLKAESTIQKKRPMGKKKDQELYKYHDFYACRKLRYKKVNGLISELHKLLLEVGNALPLFSQIAKGKTEWLKYFQEMRVIK